MPSLGTALPQQRAEKPSDRAPPPRYCSISKFRFTQTLQHTPLTASEQEAHTRQFREWQLRRGQVLPDLANLGKTDLHVDEGSSVFSNSSETLVTFEGPSHLDMDVRWDVRPISLVQFPPKARTRT